MAGAHVYPGGRVDDADADTAALGGEAVRARIGTADAHALAVAAVRELFEESGILLAEGEIPEAIRLDVAAGRAGFVDVCTDHGVQIDLDRLAVWAHWITPMAEPRRYDTWFFVARVPPGTQARHDDGETVASTWIRPEDALDACRAGDLFLAPPTWKTLEQLCPFKTVDEIMAQAPTRSVPPILPVLQNDQGQIVIVLPGDPDNPAEVGVEGPTRLRWTGTGWHTEWPKRPESVQS
jgi:8-oxo-dGTP pyrophosphatase MutT (NUDIX family)